MRMLATMLVALSFGLSGLGAAANAVAPPQSTMAAAMADSHDGCETPCDCCADGQTGTMACQGDCLSAPGLTTGSGVAPLAALPAAARIWSADARLDARAPPPLRRPPKLAS